MRIGLISPPYESVPPRFYGGTERVVYNLCRGLTHAGHEVSVFASGDSRCDGQLIPVVPEALRLGPSQVCDANPYHLRMLAQVSQHAHDFDIIHNHHDYWMLPLGNMISAPVVSTLHGRLDLPDIAAAFTSFPQNYFVSISNSQRLPLSSLPWVSTIYHGIETADFQFHPEPGKYLAFLGRISWDKRPDWAIQIAKKSGVPLKIAAKIEGPESQQYYDRYIKPHVDGNFIEYIGEISEGEKSSFLGNALGLVFPIDWPEPFGLVMIEALACGTPVLARPCGAAPEVLSDGITGYCLPDIEDLADRVEKLPSLNRKKCRQWVEEKFSLRRMTEDYIHVYEQLTSRNLFRANRFRRSAGNRRNFLHTL